jgi:putative transposase
MSYVKSWIHAVWRTKNNRPLLTPSFRKELLIHIRINATEKGLHIDSINGHVDHIHCLMALNADISISKHIQLIKGESAHWANKNNLISSKLEWADDYFAVSVSESVVSKVRQYIANQEEHHKKSTFAEEYEMFMKQFNFKGQG